MVVLFLKFWEISILFSIVVAPIYIPFQQCMRVLSFSPHAFLGLLSTRWQSRRTCAQLLLRELQNCNSLLNNHWQQNVGSHQKKIPYVQGQRKSPNKMVGGVKSHLESSPVPARDAQRTQMKPCVHQDPEARRDWARPAFECLSVPVEARVSTGLP